MSKERVTVRDTDGNSVTFTATVKESARFTVDITEHPVERGANITDHARPRLDVLTLEGVVSDLDSTSDGESAVGEPSQDAVLFFIGLKQNPRAVEITTPRVVYDSMLMASCDLPRKNSDGRAARFSLEFKEYRIVDLRKTVVQVKLAGRAKKGRQQNKVTLPAPLVSAAALGYDAIKRAGGIGAAVAGFLGGGKR